LRIIELNGFNGADFPRRFLLRNALRDNE